MLSSFLLPSSFILLLFSYLGTDNANAESIVDSIKVPSSPQHMLLDPANGKLYVPSGYTSGQVTVIDSLTNKVTNNIYLLSAIPLAARYIQYVNSKRI
jgi:YVTN family beta-propeller protein